MPKVKKSKKSTKKHTKKISFSKQVTKLDTKGYPHRLFWEEVYIAPDGAGSYIFVFADGNIPSFVSGSPTVTNAIPSIASQGMGLSFIFRLLDCVQSTQFDVIYDQYKLLKVHAKIDLMTDYLVASNSTVRGLIPEVNIVHDYDDAVAPTSPGYVRQYNNNKLRRLTSQHPSTSTSFVPKNASYVYKSTGTGIGFQQNDKQQFIDCSFPDVEHYGLKLWFDNILANLPSAPLIRIQFSGDFMFKTQR
jgi:hypothetical protein